MEQRPPPFWWHQVEPALIVNRVLGHIDTKHQNTWRNRTTLVTRCWLNQVKGFTEATIVTHIVSAINTSNVFKTSCCETDIQPSQRSLDPVHMQTVVNKPGRRSYFDSKCQKHMWQMHIWQMHIIDHHCFHFYKISEAQMMRGVGIVRECRVGQWRRHGQRWSSRWQWC